jgi:hypothetical protein
MTTVRIEIHVDRRPDDVFTFLADFRNESTWRRELVESRKLTTGPVGHGTVFEEITKPPNPAPRSVVTREINQYKPSSLIGWSQRSESWDADGRYDIVDDSRGGTRIIFENQLRGKGRSRFLIPVMIPMIKHGFIKPQFRALKAELERAAPVGTPA